MDLSISLTYMNNPREISYEEGLPLSKRLKEAFFSEKMISYLNASHFDLKHTKKEGYERLSGEKKVGTMSRSNIELIASSDDYPKLHYHLSEVNLADKKIEEDARLLRELENDFNFLFPENQIMYYKNLAISFGIPVNLVTAGERYQEVAPLFGEKEELIQSVRLTSRPLPIAISTEGTTSRENFPERFLQLENPISIDPLFGITQLVEVFDIKHITKLSITYDWKTPENFVYSENIYTEKLLGKLHN